MMRGCGVWGKIDMNNRKKTLDITFHTHHVRKCRYIIGTTKVENGKSYWITYAYIWQSIVASLSELDDNVHVKMCFELDWNNLESPTIHESSEIVWLFNNLVSTIGYDMKNLIDDDICSRINSALPTKMKIMRKDA